MENIKLYWRDDNTVLGEVDSDTFELAKMYLKDGKSVLEAALELIGRFGTALAVRIALNARKSNNRSD
ncbi:hypothetical protein A2924_02700 [Candidatus Giovannonibacteria bacterium RIFCSPLOWO2_01_FULL_44_16]|uniref:Uncharacterized protein n=1 Tax=Candidatus Giovannonibacteria bacterium RIFCSPLOWO2_01_FULL_44_16 TaxID=1798348 RepID=A0A1F5X6L2_9BACT|nr:MAG: hypothetical protein A2924_02700 [Candidatus Giovannonibacteria bacterium RIFCSPLOWO2_01_FULL_44_16]